MLNEFSYELPKAKALGVSHAVLLTESHDEKEEQAPLFGDVLFMKTE